MMSKPAMLGLVGLLAACGGSGAPSVDDAPTEQPAGMPVAEEPEPVVVPPEPVNFVFDTSDQSELSVTEDTFLFDGVTYQIDDLRVVYTNGNSAIYHNPNGLLLREGFGIASVLDSDAVAAVGSFTTPSETEYLVAPVGGFFEVPTLGNTIAGNAVFEGDYAGILVQRGGVSASGSVQDDKLGAAFVGDVTLNVNFTGFLSESTFTGTVDNRQFRSFENATLSDSVTLADIDITNGRFDDTGQIMADVSSGEFVYTEYVGPGDDIFGANPGTLTGQLGGEDGTVIAGTLSFEQITFDFGPAPDLERLDTIRSEYLEIGAFVARQD